MVISRMSTLLIKHLCWWNAQCVKRYKEKSYFKVIHNSLVFFVDGQESFKSHANSRWRETAQVSSVFQGIDMLTCKSLQHKRNNNFHSFVFINPFEQKFHWSQGLKRHIRIHTKEKPYYCQFCLQVYKESLIFL